MRSHLVLLPLALLAFGWSSLAGAGSITYPAGNGPGKGRQLVFLSGDEEYRGEEGLPMLAKILSQKYGFTCTVLFPVDADGTINPDNNRSLGDPEVLDRAEGIVMMLRFRQWPDDVMARFAAAVARGVPIIGLRTSTHAFRFPEKVETSYRSYNHFGREVLGEDWVSHWGPNRKGATRGVIETGAGGNALLRGVRDVFGDAGVYETHPVPDATILLRGAVLRGMDPEDTPDTYRKKRSSDGREQGINDPMMPVAWTRVNRLPDGKNNRVFCTTMGAATDLLSEDLRRLVINAVLWGFELPIPTRADVTVVDPYEPTAYAFKGYRRGIRPEDHALGKTLRAGDPRPPATKPAAK